MHFGELNLHRVYLRVYADHMPAIRACQNCGFVDEGHLREDVFAEGRYHDMLVIGILKQEFMAANSA